MLAPRIPAPGPRHQPLTLRHHLHPAVPGDRPESAERGGIHQHPAVAFAPGLPHSPHKPPAPTHRSPHPPPQLPAATPTTLRTHFTNESPAVSTSQRAPTPRPRTWPPAPHRPPIPATLPCTAINAGDAGSSCTAFLATTHHHARPFTPRPQPARHRPQHEPSPAHPAPAPASPRLSTTPAPSTHSDTCRTHFTNEAIVVRGYPRATAAGVCVGIDVAKAQVDVAVEPTGATWTVPRSRGGLRRAAGAAPGPAADPHRAGSQRPATSAPLAALAAAGLPVTASIRARPTPSPAPSAALAKTDRLDAQVLARFAAEVRPALRPQPSKAEQRLQTLVRRRRQLVNDAPHRAAAAPPPGAHRSTPSWPWCATDPRRTIWRPLPRSWRERLNPTPAPTPITDPYSFRPTNPRRRPRAAPRPACARAPPRLNPTPAPGSNLTTIRTHFTNESPAPHLNARLPLNLEPGHRHRHEPSPANPVRSRDTASQAHPSSQHPLSQLVVLISPTKPRSSPHPLTLAYPPTSNLATGAPRPPPLLPALPALQSTPATQAACLPRHHPPHRRPFTLTSQPDTAPARAITRHPCARSRDAASHPPPQLPGHAVTSRTFTNESIVVATSQRSPTPRPRTWPPAPHGHPDSRHSSLPCNQRRRRRQQLHCLHCHHPPSRSPVHPSTPASPTPPAARAITRTPGARAPPGSRASRASAPWPPPPCWPTCPNWAPAPVSRSPPWSGWPRSIATAAPGAGGAAAGAAAPRCAARSPWPR